MTEEDFVVTAGAYRPGERVYENCTDTPEIKLIEYRVRKVTRYVVTRYIDTGKTGSSEEKGEYGNNQIAYEVATALCRDEHHRLGWPIGDTRISYPVPVDTDGKVEPAPVESKALIRQLANGDVVITTGGKLIVEGNDIEIHR